MQAVIFDLDGTIVFSHPTHYAAYQKLFREFGIDWSYREFNDVFAGTGAPKIIADILTRNGIKDFDLPTLVKKKRDLFNSLLQKKSLATVPGFRSFLKKLNRARVKRAIASGSNRENIRAMLENIGVAAHFPMYVSGEEVAHPKPAPDIFLRAASAIGIQPEYCLVFEDTEHGVLAAVAARMKCIGLSTTTRAEILKAAGADQVIADYHAL